MSHSTEPRGNYRADRLTRMLPRLDHHARRGQRGSALYTRWRLLLFLSGALCTIILYRLGWYHVGNTTLLLFIAGFGVVAWHHSRLEDRLHRLQQWLEIKRTHVARLTLDWKGLPNRPLPADAEHPVANDLDVIGHHSLFRVIDTTVSTLGRTRLLSWLLAQPLDPNTWERRQTLVKELTPLSLLRDRLALEGRLVEQHEIDGERLLAVLRSPAGYPGLSALLAIETALALMTAGLLLAALLDWMPGYWMFSFAAYAFIYLLLKGRTEEVLDHAMSLHNHLERLAGIFGYLERRTDARRPVLGELCGPLHASTSRPSRALRRAASILHRLSLKANPLLHLLVNAVGPWDLYHTDRLRRLQEEVRQVAPTWFEVLAELDAACALATFAYLHPGYCWPVSLSASSLGEDNGSPASVAARNLGHPLIPQSHRVANDLELKGLGRILLVTGSNMSGKSTFLRTVGINLCLAQAGAPVCADRFEWTWVRVASCIRIDDSLEAGLSFFYAEVKRLKTILDATRDAEKPPVVFLIDEVFKGTNNRERLLGGRALISALATGNGFGLISTHDLELTELERQIPTLANVHFQETVKAEELHFDYKLRPGPCPTTNALRIMELQGLPVPDQGQHRKY